MKLEGVSPAGLRGGVSVPHTMHSSCILVHPELWQPLSISPGLDAWVCSTPNTWGTAGTITSLGLAGWPDTGLVCGKARRYCRLFVIKENAFLIDGTQE